MISPAPRQISAINETGDSDFLHGFSVYRAPILMCQIRSTLSRPFLSVAVIADYRIREGVFLIRFCVRKCSINLRICVLICAICTICPNGNETLASKMRSPVSLRTNSDAYTECTAPKGLLDVIRVK